jgi:hypothetical protein
VQSITRKVNSGNKAQYSPAVEVRLYLGMYSATSELEGCGRRDEVDTRDWRVGERVAYRSGLAEIGVDLVA